jgi:hypothetical protein
VTAPTLAQQPIRVRVRDLIERVFWTGVVSVITNIVGALAFGVDAWKAALLSAIAPTLNAVLVVARWRLSVLPDPGAAVAEASYNSALADVKALTPSPKKAPAKKRT